MASAHTRSPCDESQHSLSTCDHSPTISDEPDLWAPECSHLLHHECTPLDRCIVEVRPGLLAIGKIPSGPRRQRSQPSTGIVRVKGPCDRVRGRVLFLSLGPLEEVSQDLAEETISEDLFGIEVQFGGLAPDRVLVFESLGEIGPASPGGTAEVICRHPSKNAL
jgi:hypothetical protein